MGLDMFLFAGQKGKKNGREVAYWRKANQIHAWFVKEVQEGVDDCGAYEVSRGNLSDLYEVCKEVLENNDLAPSLLPSTSGFFFGSTAYDEFYFNDLKDTMKQLKAILNDVDLENHTFEYQSSW